VHIFIGHLALFIAVWRPNYRGYGVRFLLPHSGTDGFCLAHLLTTPGRPRPGSYSTMASIRFLDSLPLVKAVSFHALNTSATVHAWAMQPRGVNGGFAVKDLAQAAHAVRIQLWIGGQWTDRASARSRTPAGVHGRRARSTSPAESESMVQFHQV